MKDVTTSEFDWWLLKPETNKSERKRYELQDIYKSSCPSGLRPHKMKTQVQLPRESFQEKSVTVG